jgi:hypothetical protein
LWIFAGKTATKYRASIAPASLLNRGISKPGPPAISAAPVNSTSSRCSGIHGGIIAR